MALRTHRFPRVFTREDGRERIAIPLWRGILYALGSIAIGFVATFVTMIVIVVVVVLATGEIPSKTPGHPLMAISELLFYVVGGWFAWRGLRALGVRPFRALTRHDVRTILIGITGLIVLRFGTALLLVLTDQTKHVQAGFEHFDVTSKLPGITTFSAVLAVLSLVVIAPVVEEIVFRGLLFGALASRLGILASTAITALLFGAIHADPVLFPSLVALGIITALAYTSTGNLWVAIILHALNNSLGAAVLVTTSLTKH